MKEIRWTAPEFHYHEKGPSWYWLSVIIAIVVAGLAIFLNNFLFAIFVVMAEVMMLFWARQRPRELEFYLDERGLVINGRKFYPYEAFMGFASYGHEVIFQKKGRLASYVKVMAYPSDASRIKIFLSGRLPEIEYEESLFDHIFKLLRF